MAKTILSQMIKVGRHLIDLISRFKVCVQESFSPCSAWGDGGTWGFDGYCLILFLRALSQTCKTSWLRVWFWVWHTVLLTSQTCIPKSTPPWINIIRHRSSLMPWQQYSLRYWARHRASIDQPSRLFADVVDLWAGPQQSGVGWQSHVISQLGYGIQEYIFWDSSERINLQLVQ